MDELKFSCQSDYDKFAKELSSLEKENYVGNVGAHKAILNCPSKVLGIKMQTLRKIAAKISKSCPDEFLKFSVPGSYEEMLLRGLVIAMLPDLDRMTGLLLQYVRQIDCWSECDCVASTMHALKTCKNKRKYFEKWSALCFSDREFEARFGIVCLLVNFLQEEFIDEILEITAKVQSEKYYVQMALAWLISVAYIKFKDRTERLLESGKLSAFVQSKALQKCRESFRLSDAEKQKLQKERK